MTRRLIQRRVSSSSAKRDVEVLGNSAVVTDDAVRPVIAHAWKRARLSGLNPGMAVRNSHVVDVDQRSRLMQAATPVLDLMNVELRDTPFTVLLADRDCAIVARRLGQTKLGKILDRVSAVPGMRYIEDNTGTNALATAYELHEPIAIRGAEHYLDELKVFTCYGAPIVNPVTRRVEGVLDVTGPAADSTSLLGPFVRAAVREIELRLLEAGRSTERRLLTTFQEHARRRSHAVVVLSDSVVLTNPIAEDLLSGDDHSRLRAVTDGISVERDMVRSLTLASGSEVTVRARPIVGTDGILYEVVPRASVAHHAAIPQISCGPAPVTLVVGEPGTGRSQFAAELAGVTARRLDCTASLTDDSWIAEALRLLSEVTDRPVIVDDVHVLGLREAAALGPALRRVQSPVVMTSTPVTEPEPELAALLSVALCRHELTPLRMYGTKFADFAHKVLFDVVGEHSLRITPSAMRILTAQPWAGNISELRAVLAASARERRVGDITPADLPEHIAARGTSSRTLTILESAERDAIVKALASNGGNKSAAAADLGIGRTTLYQRLRYFHL
ncbi:MAG: helix-turn-helix domain-containing protein [Mycobacterium sp.]|nr:helix-turn-helix domain-containing protein [Mycobacterium sp.]